MENDSNDIEFMISQLIDNELPDEEQKKLFLRLAEDQSARQALSEFMQIKKDTFRYYSDAGNIQLSSTQISSPEIPLSQKHFLHKPQLPSAKIYRRVLYFSSAAALILLTLLSWQQVFFNKGNEEYNSLKKMYSLLQSDYGQLQKTVHNQTSVVDKNNSPQASATVIQKVNKRTEGTQKKRSSSDEKEESISIREKSRYAYLSKAHVVEIDKNDFLVPQIPGN